MEWSVCVHVLFIGLQNIILRRGQEEWLPLMHANDILIIVTNGFFPLAKLFWRTNNENIQKR